MNAASFLFDMDGVIADSMRRHAAAWKSVLAGCGIDVADIDIYRREGMSGRDSVADIFKEKGRRPPDERLYRRLQRIKNALFEGRPVRIYPHVKGILGLIKRRGIPMALVTGSPMRAVRHVVPPDLLRLFDAVVTSEAVARCKPDPEPYSRALALLGSMRGGGEARAARPGVRAICIENSPMGIRSAKGAGAVCYALETTLPRRYLAGADRIFEDHRSLLAHLRAHQ